MGVDHGTGDARYQAEVGDEAIIGAQHGGAELIATGAVPTFDSA